MHVALQPGELRSSVRRLQELPPLPHSAQRLLAILNDDDAHIEAIARVIEESPPLAARIVGLANSAYFGCPGKVHAVRDAIIRVLGLRLVRTLALGITVSNSLECDRCPAFSGEDYWASALLSANLARSLASGVHAKPTPAPDTAHLCGLLHNLGLLVLVHVAPAEMQLVLQVAAQHSDRSLTCIEQELLGFHHNDAGAWLAYHWQLPEEVAVVIEHHRSPEYRGRHWPLSQLVAMCVRWARQRLAGVESPWIAPGVLRSLGVDQGAMAAAIEVASRSLDDISELAELLSRS